MPDAHLLEERHGGVRPADLLPLQHPFGDPAAALALHPARPPLGRRRGRAARAEPVHGGPPPRGGVRAADPGAAAVLGHRAAGCRTGAAPPAPPRFLFVGRVTPSKGIGALVEEFAALPGYELLVVGDGDLRPALERRYAGCANIRFAGRLPQADLAAAYRGATALVFPSLAPETFGLSVVEAFACGTPAIVRDAGGAGELVEDTGGGIVYRTGGELRQAVSRLAGDPALRDALGRRAREGFLRRYTVERHMDEYLGHVGAIRASKGVH